MLYSDEDRARVRARNRAELRRNPELMSRFEETTANALRNIRNPANYEIRAIGVGRNPLAVSTFVAPDARQFDFGPPEQNEQNELLNTMRKRMEENEQFQEARGRERDAAIRDRVVSRMAGLTAAQPVDIDPQRTEQQKRIRMTSAIIKLDRETKKNLFKRITPAQEAVLGYGKGQVTPAEMFKKLNER